MYLHKFVVTALFYICLAGSYINALIHMQRGDKCFVFGPDKGIQMSGHQYYTVIGACTAEITHNIEVGSKWQKNLNMVLKYRE
jgi:hypothetical protein